MLKKLLLYPLFALCAALALWVLWSLVAYRDIPVAVLEERYGAPSLSIAQVDGVPLRYRVEGQGPALLLIHSHYFTMRIWDDWIDTLAPHFTVIRFDMTSHGFTGPEPNGNYSMERDLLLINGLLEKLDVDRFSVVGSSLGGNMAFHLAARQPQRIEKLVLINSGGLPREGARGTGGTIPAWVDYVSYLVPTTVFKSFLQWVISDDTLVTNSMAAEFHDMLRREGNRFAEFDRLRGFDVGEPLPLLASITAPTLIMWGKDNPQLPLQQAERFEQLLTAAESVQRRDYPGVGHVLPIEIPAQGSADLLQFLQGGD
jgi:pimeloyl-ACP methyl ester carboxylesterase